jgi:hypothetical protein
MQTCSQPLAHDGLASAEPLARLPELPLPLRAPQLMVVLVGTAVALLLVHLVVVSSYLDNWHFPARERFYFDHENNLPTFFSTFILLLAAALTGLIGMARRRAGDGFALHWQVMALVFAALSVDEAASFHEVLILPLRRVFDLSGFFWFGWVIPGAAFAAAFALAYWRFLLHLPGATRRLLLTAGVLYVLGAVGLEMVGGHVFLIGEAQQDMRTYMVVMTLEESLEMGGILLLIHALLQQLHQCCGNVRLQVEPR